MDFLFKQVIINSKKYGKVKAWIVRKSMYGNGYLVFTNKGKKALTGFITESGKEIIPLAEMQLTGMLIANKGRDICFEFQYPDSEILEYYHVKTLDNGKTKLAFKTDRHAEIPAFICTLENTEDYWAIQIGTQDPQYAIYDYKKAKQITTFFDEVCYQYEGGDPSHCFYYGMAIETDIKQPNGTDTPHIHTSICGFLDENGNLSSQIYDTESHTLYSSYMYGPNTLSPNFKKLIDLLTVGYEELYYEKDEKINNTLSYLYDNPNLSEKPKDLKKGEKVLEFKPRKKM